MSLSLFSVVVVFLFGVCVVGGACFGFFPPLVTHVYICLVNHYHQSLEHIVQKLGGNPVNLHLMPQEDAYLHSLVWESAELNRTAPLEAMPGWVLQGWDISVPGEPGTCATECRQCTQLWLQVYVSTLFASCYFFASTIQLYALERKKINKQNWSRLHAILNYY